MGLFASFELILMAAMFSTQVLAGDRKVRTLSSLGLEVDERGGTGLKHVTNSEGFFAQVLVSVTDKAIAVDAIENPKGSFDSYEAILSIWEDQSKLDVGSLEQIKYYNVAGHDCYTIDKRLLKSRYNPNDRRISGPTYFKAFPNDAEPYELLSKTSLGNDAMKMCTEFQGMSNRYIESFKIGTDDDSGRWMKIKFATTSD